jgi:DNA-binding transcriptional MerR regulator
MGGNVALRQSGEGRELGDTHAERRLYSIGDLASETGVTHRALRIYEEQGLLAPQRIGNQRIYSHRDRARLILVLRGKRLGFSLADIREMLEMYDVDPQHLEQLRVTLKKAQARIVNLEHQQVAIAETLAELRAGERGVLEMIKQKEAGGGASNRRSVNPPPHPALSPPRGGEGN